MSRKYIPLLRTTATLLLAIGVPRDLPLPRLRVLHKRTLLLVEIAKDTQHGTFVDHAAGLSSPASVTGSFPSSPDVGNARERRWFPLR